MVRALRSVMMTIALAALVAGACDGVSPPPPPQPVSLEGELLLYSLILRPGEKGENEFFALRLESGDERRLAFEVAPAVEPGTRVHVWGLDDGAVVAVLRLEALHLR
jgi:hypothetical protein